MNDKQINTIVDHVRQMVDDWEEISQDFESKRALIDMLDIRITLTMTPEGKRKGLLAGKLPAGPKEFWGDIITK